MRIREYKPNDRIFCIKIFIGNVPKFFAEHELHDFKFLLNSLEENVLAKNENEKYFVTEIENKIVACAGVYFIPEEKIGGLAWGMVDAEHHYIGIGRKFLQFRINYLKENFNVSQIIVDTSQHTFKFFEKHGFVTEKITENGYSKNLHRYDMMLKIT